MSLAGYPPHEQRHQMEERARQMRFARSDWVGTVEDADFCHRFLGSAVPFSGDARPADVEIGGHRG